MARLKNGKSQEANQELMKIAYFLILEFNTLDSVPAEVLEERTKDIKRKGKAKYRLNYIKGCWSRYKKPENMTLAKQKLFELWHKEYEDRINKEIPFLFKPRDTITIKDIKDDVYNRETSNLLVNDELGYLRAYREKLENERLEGAPHYSVKLHTTTFEKITTLITVVVNNTQPANVLMKILQNSDNEEQQNLKEVKQAPIDITQDNNYNNNYNNDYENK